MLRNRMIMNKPNKPIQIEEASHLGAGKLYHLFPEELKNAFRIIDGVMDGVASDIERKKDVNNASN